LVRFQVPKKRQQPPQSLQILSIKDFLLHALLDGCRNFEISAKLAAIESSRVFPSSPWINYQVAGGAAHIGLLFFRSITSASVVSSLWFGLPIARDEVHDNFEATYARIAYYWNNSTPRSLLGSACETQDRSKSHGTRIIALASRHSVADYSSGLVARWAARIILRVPALLCKNVQVRSLECSQEGSHVWYGAT